MRKEQFGNNRCYHIYNRGVDKRNIFLDDNDKVRFLRSMREFNVVEPIGSLFEKDKMEREKGKLKKLDFQGNQVSGRLVEFVCYCLNDNHYHFLLKQSAEKGISKFMHRLGLGYTKYFNRKHDRTGSLFSGAFKAVEIENNSRLLWISGYINANAKIHKISETENYKWCSLPDYLERREGTLCAKEIVIGQFNNDAEEYGRFVEMVAGESSKRKDMKEYLLEIK